LLTERKKLKVENSKKIEQGVLRIKNGSMWEDLILVNREKEP
jgi:hypothetical protein